jgi:Asp-tRNA(Asn)/Glu-tRNA(Gln) amidotransferase C subunit
MTTKEIKIEINKVIEDIPETALEDILHYLRDLKNFSSEDIRISAFLSKIVREDKELLTRLAK